MEQSWSIQFSTRIFYGGNYNSRKDEPETGIPVNFRYGNLLLEAGISRNFFRRKMFPPEKISGISGFRQKFLSEKFSLEKFPRKTNKVLQEKI